MKLTENADSDKYGYSGSGIGFDARSTALKRGSFLKSNVKPIPVLS